jgi:hypothetical protein
MPIDVNVRERRNDRHESYILLSSRLSAVRSRDLMSEGQGDVFMTALDAGTSAVRNLMSVE